ncbi:MAG: HlyC/CorC family transporter [Gemmatimonadaceae bacterium]|nr:HlyC/CorC family transporter [Gemmatimonadaceae bacterium]
MLGRLSAIVVLVLLNGFFVGAEFALVRSRRNRLEAMVRTGDRLARVALRASSNISGLLPASQLGVTLSSLALGWVAQSTMTDVFARLPAGVEIPARVSIAAIIAFAIASYVHVVFGELVPKAAALNHPERMAKWLVPPLMLFASLSRPFVWIINRTSNFMLRLFGLHALPGEDSVHSPDELRILVEQAQEGGAIEAQDADMIDAVLEFSEKNASGVMTPRTDVAAFALEASLDDVLVTVEDRGYSRYPVYEDSIDNIVGLVLTKDILIEAVRRRNEFTLQAVMRPVHMVPGSREVEDVLADFKRLKEHMAVVLDEFGGTAGVVTMEDLLEEIVGEILDEYDDPAEKPVETRGGETIVPGSTHIGDLNERFALEVPDEDYTTIGGYVFGTLGRLPAPGDHVTAGGAIFTVREMDGRRIETLAVDLHSLGDRREAERDQQAPRTAAAPG